jgi:hypothetical protein
MTEGRVRSFLGAVLAGLVLGLAVASAYHRLDGPVGCRSTPHVHAAPGLGECCVLCRQSHCSSTPPDIGEPRSGVLPEPDVVQSDPRLPLDLLSDRERLARAPPAAFPRTS